MNTPATIRRVAFTCDLMRFSLGPEGYRHAQIGNMRWLLAVLGGQTDWPRLGVQVRCVAPAGDFETLRRQVSSPAVLKAYEDDAPAAWARRFDSMDFDVRTGLADELLDSDLVVGFEIPPGMRRMLHAHGRPYISFHIHPLRFLRDLCLGAATNSTGLLAHLERVTLPAAEVHAQVRRFGALLARQAWPALEVPPDWPLVIGQTARDAVLIEGGRFADWPDFDPAVTKALDACDGCVLLEHPYRHDSARIAQHLRSLTGRPVVMSNANGYAAVFHARARTQVLTLASSLGVEAQAIGLPTTFLLGDPRERQQLAGIDVGSSHALGHGVLGPDFWKAVFTAPSSPPRRAPARTAFALGGGYLRQSLDSWAYAALERGLPALRARKVLFRAHGTAAAAEQELGRRLAAAVEPPEAWKPVRGAAQGDLGVEYIAADAPMAPGECRRFDGRDPWAPLLPIDFSDREAWGVWGARTETRLALQLAPASVHAHADIQWRLTLAVVSGSATATATCHILHAGQTLARVELGPGVSAPLLATVHTVAAGPSCTLDLQLAGTGATPTEAATEDTPALRVALLSVEVAVAPGAPIDNDAPAAPPCPMPI